MFNLFDIQYILTTYGYVGVFVIVFLESGILFALPGDSLLFTAGLLASGLGFHFPFLVPLIIIATFFGGVAGYWIGVYIETLQRYKFFSKLLKPEHISKTHLFFEKHGMRAVLISRFVPVVRTFLPMVAGIARMDFVKFLKYNFLSSVLWAITMTSAGYVLGVEFPQIKHYVHYFIFAIIFVSMIPIILEWLRVRRGRLETQTK